MPISSLESLLSFQYFDRPAATESPAQTAKPTVS
jgi:hypothetical protein